jgi:cytochrome c oxidase assembly protein subunit 11
VNEKPALEERSKKTRRLLIVLTIVVILMFGFSFALVPLYNTFCTITGLNGKTGSRMRATSAQTNIDKTRTITIEFVTHVSADMPWDFEPVVKKMTLHPGEMRRVVFMAKNKSAETIVGQAIPSVSPGLAAAHLLKTECFCFNSQTLKPHEEKEMPLVFYIDPALSKDIPRLTLSYTLFNVSPKKPN